MRWTYQIINTSGSVKTCVRRIRTHRLQFQLVCYSPPSLSLPPLSLSPSLSSLLLSPLSPSLSSLLPLSPFSFHPSRHTAYTSEARFVSLCRWWKIKYLTKKEEREEGREREKGGGERRRGGEEERRSTSGSETGAALLHLVSCSGYVCIVVQFVSSSKMITLIYVFCFSVFCFCLFCFVSFCFLFCLLLQETYRFVCLPAAKIQFLFQ